MNKWMTEDDLLALVTAMSVDEEPVCDFLCSADAKKLFNQAREANRMREGLEVLQKDAEALGLVRLYFRIRELLEGEK